ncbi:FecR domain-containing protein [Sinorhizobium sp. BG8]|uniref:FecR family protein n=1 Tax=Sinorhizobium sp. BG8 TaxID=2613773 RepID=UPI00193E1F76|nr:FecR domain-containing protein [Sinorhizobium sp. BG8]QRM56054.1 hypothetical protein F3Y30_17085 [Sinorhizobium sp. BG8]
MSHLRCAAIAALGVALYGWMPTLAAETVGEAVHIKTEVSGSNGPIAVKDPVYRDERIRTSRSGLGQFTFRDGTKLAVGWGSSVVIDKFVYDDSRSFKKLTVAAAKGTFRWVSGKSKHTAYEIVTPAGTIGVRGTVFDFYVGADGTTAIVLLSGAADFCGPGGCRELKRRCECVVAKRNGELSDVRRINRSIFAALDNPRALPFLSGDQELLGRVGGSGCGLQNEVRIRTDKKERNIRQPEPRPDPDKPDDKPTKPDKDKPTKPDKDKPTKPDKDKPTKPDRDKPTKPDRDKPTKPDRDKPTKPDRDKPTTPDRDKPTTPDKDPPSDRDPPGDSDGGPTQGGDAD